MLSSVAIVAREARPKQTRTPEPEWKLLMRDETAASLGGSYTLSLRQPEPQGMTGWMQRIERSSLLPGLGSRRGTLPKFQSRDQTLDADFDAGSGRLVSVRCNVGPVAISAGPTAAGLRELVSSRVCLSSFRSGKREKRSRTVPQKSCCFAARCRQARQDDLPNLRIECACPLVVLWIHAASFGTSSSKEGCFPTLCDPERA